MPVSTPLLLQRAADFFLSTDHLCGIARKVGCLSVTIPKASTGPRT